MPTTLDAPASMSAPRGGRGGGGDRGRSNNNTNRSQNARGRGNGAPTTHSTDRPSQQVYQRGGARGGSRGGAARGNTTNTTNSNNRSGSATRTTPGSRGSSPNIDISGLDPTGGANSTPYPQEDYAKRLEHIRAVRPLLFERFVKERRMNPKGQMKLKDSVKIYGLCTDMCPESERVRRIVEDDVKRPECTPETQHLPRRQRIPDESRMVKAFKRSSAGDEVELVSELRSPATCLKTVNYLMDRLDHDDFEFLHSWTWDRVRCVRKDLSTQCIEKPADINIYLTTLEQSARFYLLCPHHMARTTKEDYSHQQDIEQLNHSLISLVARYKDNRRMGYVSENEAEFYAYRLILSPLFADSQHEDEMHRLPSSVRNNPRMKVALEIYRAMKSVIITKSNSFVQAQSNWKHLWDLLKSPSVSYLMACAAEINFQRVRHTILDALWRVYRMGSSKKPRTVDTWTTDQLTQALGLDTEAEAVSICEAFGFTFGQLDNGQRFLDVCQRGYQREVLGLPGSVSPQIFSEAIVEAKRCGRTISAITRAMSVQNAKAKGLMIDVTNREEIDFTNYMADDDTLFVPEDALPKPNVFSKAHGTPQDISKVSPGSDLSTNPFIKNAAGVLPTYPGIGSTTIQPGIFNPAKNDIKFAPTDSTATPAKSISKAPPFVPRGSISQTPTAAAVNGAPAAGFNFFTQAAKAQAAQSASTPPASTSNLFGIPGLSAVPNQAQTPSAAPSFTPAGSPAPPESTVQEEEKRKVEEADRRRKAEAEAKAAVQAQQKRVREEQARQAREAAERQQAAERQRIEAERERQRIQQAEHDRLVQEARQRQQREEAARFAKLQAREKAYAALTEDVMWNADEGLMLQFIENLAGNVAAEVMAAEQEEKRKMLEEKRLALLNAIYEQRELAFKRSVMATWIAKVEKKKRARQAKDRRRRLKEQKARMMNAEVPNVASQTEAQAAANQHYLSTSFQKPQAPASARRAKRTEQRRGVQGASHNITSEFLPHQNIKDQQAAAPTVLTPISMSNSLGSSAGYSEAYQKSTAPIDRTESDYFILRAQGLDPSKHRKRSFDSSSGEEEPLAIEPKRPKLSTPELEQSSLPRMTATENHEVRLRALQQRRLEMSGGSQPPVQATATGLPPTRLRSLLQQAKELVGPSPPKASPPSVKHDFGRSVPNLGISATAAARQSLLGKSVGTAAAIDRPAFYARKSRFVPQHLYGQGGEAAREYRRQLNSPPGSRPASTEPLAVSSPIPTQVSYLPPDGYSQEEYSEEDVSGAEEMDAADEEEYAGDEETEEEEEEDTEVPADQRQSNHYQYDDEDEDGDSPMSGNDFCAINTGYVNGDHGHYEEEGHGEYEEYTDEDGEMEDGSEEESETQQEYFARPVQPIYGGHKLQPQPQMGGNTEDDAIELSD
ncbi:SAC3/GANP/Nin1/mts3/eIF-3 p25 family-domain-containing protein [Paraphoma chrysanthemicola]|uniref:SAC3/GANP/Nin1/mts3/eIF-3 p25 family-domain-containing protein n=1 Tax=Paraphoma chrysanthemicola TaxID=798071 RepID=A0A8K0R751_9PLEO|nr:SAC3/GANP/Nin1/mts3/eIF-3 p25 family-domain-containing protein [Paraphoma chrysanthemicola]